MAVQENLIEITVWYRGVVEGRLARKLTGALASAARAEGKYVQAFDNYVDLPDRVNVPCRSYARICPEPIAEPYIYENHSPSIVATTDAALVKGCNVLKGLEPGGVLVVNTDRDPAQILGLLADLQELERLRLVATIDAGRGAQARAPYGAGEGAADKAVTLSTAGPLLGAIARVSGVVNVETLKAQEDDPEGIQRGYDNVRILENPAFRLGATPPPEERHLQSKVDLVVPAPPPNGRQPAFLSGNFRTLRPVVDQEACTLCRMCWISCPDSCITLHEDGGPEKVSIDLDYCKGCGICWNVCPVNCIAPRDELEFAGGMVRITY